MDVIDVDCSDDSDSYEVDGFSRQRPSTPRHRQQQQQQLSVPKPKLEPRPRQQKKQTKPAQQRPKKEYPVVANVDLTISDEEEGEIVENVQPAVNGNLNLLNNLNENGIELDGLPLETLEMKKEEIELKLEQEDDITEQEPQNGLEAVSDNDDDDENAIMARNPFSQVQPNELVEPHTLNRSTASIENSTVVPITLNISLDDVSDDDDGDKDFNPFSQLARNELLKPLDSNKLTSTAKPNETPTKFNTTNRISGSITPSFSMAGCSNSTPKSFTANRPDFSSNKTNKLPNSNRASQKSPIQNDHRQTFKPNQTTRSPASNASIKSANNASNRAQFSPNHREQLENVSDDDFEMDVTPSKQPPQTLRNELVKPHASNKIGSASNSKEGRVIFTANRLPSRMASWSNETIHSPVSNRANQTPRTDVSIQLPNNTLNQPQSSLNQSVQSLTSNASVRSPNSNSTSYSHTSNRLPFVQNETMQSVNSNKAKKSPTKQSFVPYQTPKTTNQNEVPKSSSSFSNEVERSRHDCNGLNFSTNHTAEWLRSYGLVVSPNPDAIESIPPNHTAPHTHSFMPIDAAVHGNSPNQVHPNQTDQLVPIANQRSTIYAPLDIVSNDMLSLNVDHFAQRKTPVRRRAPRTPESGIAASELSCDSDYELDLYPSNVQTNPEPQQSSHSNNASNETHSNLNISNQINLNRESHLNNNSGNGTNQPPPIRSLKDFDDLVKNAIYNTLAKNVPQKRKSPSPPTSDSTPSSNDVDLYDLLQPSKKQATNNQNALDSDSIGRQQIQSESETDATPDDGDDDGDNDDNDADFEPNADDMDDDNKADENDDYDSDCSGYSRETLLFEDRCQKPMKSERKNETEESSDGSDETLIDFSQFYAPNQSE